VFAYWNMTKFNKAVQNNKIKKYVAVARSRKAATLREQMGERESVLVCACVVKTTQGEKLGC